MHIVIYYFYQEVIILAKVVQVSMSDQDYEYLAKRAEEKGITVSMFIKQSVLPRREYDEAFERLIKLVDDLKVGEEFSIRELFSNDWKKISKGTRLSLGRCFFQSIDKGQITNVRPLDRKDATHSQMYIKEV